MSLTNNTKLLNDLKAKAENLPKQENNEVDLSGITVTSSDVLSNKYFIAQNGSLTEGAIVNNGTTYKNVSCTANTTYRIPAGFHKEQISIQVNVPSSGTNTQDATATKNDILLNKIAYGKNNQQLKGTIPIRSSSDCELNNGVFSFPYGYYDNGVNYTMSNSTQQVQIDGGQLIVSNSVGYVPKVSSKYYDFAVLDTNLKPENIKKGVKIFGTTGDYEPPYQAPSMTYTLINPSTTSYPVQSIGDGWYQTTNSLENSSISYCKIVIDCQEETAFLGLECICGGEFPNHDYGFIGKLDTEVINNNDIIEENLYTTVVNQTESSLTFQVKIPKGNHYFYIGYKKDASVDNNIDYLKFRILNTPSQSQISIRSKNTLGMNKRYLEISDLVYNMSQITNIAIIADNYPFGNVNSKIILDGNLIRSPGTSFTPSFISYYDGYEESVFRHDNALSFDYNPQAASYIESTDNNIIFSSDVDYTIYVTGTMVL